MFARNYLGTGDDEGTNVLNFLTRFDVSSVKVVSRKLEEIVVLLQPTLLPKSG